MKAARIIHDVTNRYPMIYDRMFRPHTVPVPSVSIVHILRMTGINYSDAVTVNLVGIIPFVCICHVAALPSSYRWFPAWQGFLDVENRKDGIVNITFHVIKRIGVSVLKGNVSIERPYLGNSAFVKAIVILHR